MEVISNDLNLDSASNWPDVHYLFRSQLGSVCSVGEGSRIRSWEADLRLLLKPVTTARSDRKAAKTSGETFLSYEINFGIYSPMKALSSLLPLKAPLFQVHFSKRSLKQCALWDGSRSGMHSRPTSSITCPSTPLPSLASRRGWCWDHESELQCFSI